MVEQRRPESLREIMQRINARRSAQPSGTANASPPIAPQDHCPKCGGRGFLEDINGPGLSSSLVPCKCKAGEMDSDRLRRLQVFSNLGNLSRYTFATLRPNKFEGTDDDRHFQHALQKAREFSLAPEGWFVLTGPPSTGKTHVAASIVNSQLEQNRVTLYLSVPDLLDQLRPSYDSQSGEGYAFTYEQVVSVPVLVLDDLGRHNATDWAQEKLHQVLNHRFNAMLPTVFVIEGLLADLDYVMASRFQDKDLVTLVQTGVVRRPGGNIWLPSRWMLENMRLDDFKVFGHGEYRQQRRQALDAAELFTRKPDGWLVFSGPTGVGKTHLASGITQRLYHNHDVVYVRAQQMLNTLLNSFRASSESESFLQLFTRLSEVDVLVLDNLGSENDTKWNRATLEELLVARHDSRLPTVVTTSYDLSEEIGPIASRLNDATFSTVICLTGDDFRRRAQAT